MRADPRGLALLCLGLLPTLALAQRAAGATPAAAPALPPEVAIDRRTEPPKRAPAEGASVAGGEELDASVAIDEMIDELAADLARLGSRAVSPVLLDRVQLSENLNPQFAAILEGRIVRALLEATTVRVVRCDECSATFAGVENGQWVVRRGIVRPEQLAAIGQRLGAQTLLRVRLTLQARPNALALDVSLERTADSSFVFAESYRVHPSTGMLYRSADRAQSREARLKQLEDKLAGRPSFGQDIQAAMMLVPSTKPGQTLALGLYGSFRFYERFGDAFQYQVGLSAGGYLNTALLAGAILEGSLYTQLTRAAIWFPRCYLGAAGGAFITGSAGNSPLLGLRAECVFGERLAATVGLSYLFPFDVQDAGYNVGGFTPHAGMAFVW